MVGLRFIIMRNREICTRLESMTKKNPFDKDYAFRGIIEEPLL